VFFPQGAQIEHIMGKTCFLVCPHVSSEIAEEILHWVFS